MPEPAPATTSSGPSTWRTASRWAGIQVGEEILVRCDGHASMLAATPATGAGRRPSDRSGPRGRSVRRDPQGQLDDIPRAAAMRQRAWPEQIITAEGCATTLTNVPERAERMMLAWEDGGEIVGWATAGRSWWRRRDGPSARLGSPSTRAAAARGSAPRSPRPSTSTWRRIGVTANAGGSLDEPAARALAARRGFREIGRGRDVGGRSSHGDGPIPIPPACATCRSPSSTTRSRSTSSTWRCRTDIPNEEFDGHLVREVEETSSGARRSIDEDASLVAFVGGELAAGDDDPRRPAERPRPEQRHGRRGGRSAGAAWRGC